MPQSNQKPVKRGRQFLHIPGPTMMPDRILRAMDRPAIDHRGPEYAELAERCYTGVKAVFKTKHPVLIAAAAGHGAWEAALANTCSPGDRVLMAETGAFSAQWKQMAESFNLEVDYVPGDWRHGVDPEAIEARLADDKAHAIKAVAVVHNETATGVTSRVAEIRQAIDNAKHPALFMVDTISSLGSMDFRMDHWQVDVAIGGSQKGFMLPPGLGFTAVSDKALHAAKSAQTPRHYFDWARMMPDGKPAFISTPPTSLIFGLVEALDMLEEEGLDACFARHACLAEATRRAVEAWGLELNAIDPVERSNSITAALVPDGHDADVFRSFCLDHYNLVLAGGLMKLQGKLIRIGHLGDLNEPMILGTLATIEAALAASGMPHTPGGINAAINYLAEANHG